MASILVFLSQNLLRLVCEITYCVVFINEVLAVIAQFLEQKFL